MIRMTMSVGRKWLGAFACAIVGALVGSHAAVAQVTTPSAAISFPKKAVAATAKKSAVRGKATKKRYVKRRVARKTARKSVRRTARRAASAKRRVVRRAYKKRNYKRRMARLSRKARNSRKRRGIYRSRGRGSLMATLKSVKPKGLPLSLAAAVVTVESGWRVNARGASGERGLMQLMPATARMMGARGNLYNPRINMRAGTKYLHWCYRRARGNVAVTIGCYNRGPGLMWSWNKNKITRRYVGKVRRYMRRS